jgi:serine protease inhibitor
MIVILPDAIDGLSDVEEKLLTINLAQEMSALDEVLVRVSLPKFKLEETMDMNPVLQAVCTNF